MRIAVALLAAIVAASPYVFLALLVDTQYIEIETLGYADVNGWLAVARHGLSGLFIIFGILFSSAYTHAENKDATWRELLAQFLNPNSIRPLFAAPIIFLANYLITRDLTDPITTYLLSFESGFFAEAVLTKRRSRYE